MTDNNDTSTTKPSANGDDYVNDGTPKDTRKREHVDGDQSPSLDSKRSKRSRGDDSGAKENSPEKNEEHKKTEDDANGVKSDKKEKSKDKEKKEKKKERKDDRKSRDKDKERRRSDRDDRDRKKERKERDMHDKGKERDRDRADRRETMEEGEISEHVVKREPSARDLERRRQYEEELKKEQAGAIPEEEDRPVWSLVKAQAEASSRQCPYLDTIDRNMLDFDFEKLCSVSLSHLNVYACMICGKYFQGRGTSTHAYTHSLDTDHRVFLNLQTLKFYCLPDMYEVIDPSLDDVKYVLKPTFSDKLIRSLDSWTRPTRAYDNTSYFPGVVGLNNIKENDYENVILHALSHVPPLRDYFLKEENYANIKRPPGDKLELLTKRFGELVRKLWNTKAFKAHVSPHEMLQSIVITSKKRFQFIKQGDASEFLSFLLNTLHIALNGTQKTSSSIIYKSFRGRMRQYTRKVLPVDASEEFREQMQESDEYKEEVKEMPFLYLSLDLPPAPLYRDAQLQNIIPQVPLSTLLTKFNGEAEKEYKTYKENFMKRFELLSLPEYLIIVYQRFRKNQFFVEKNPTIVNFPISNVDLYDCLAPEVRSNHKYTTYDLVSNIVHDGKPRDSQQGTEGDEGHYRVQIHHKGSGKWFELEDLHVKDILPQMITLAESYIQVWQLNRTKTRDERINEDEGELEEAPIDPLSVLVKQAQEASTKKEEKVEDR